MTEHSPLPPIQQRVLDFLSESELRNDDGTPIAELVRLQPPVEQNALQESLAALKSARLITLGGTGSNEAFLTMPGALAAGNAGEWGTLGSKLLEYLNARLESEGGAFTEYTWDDLKRASVAASDDQRKSFARIILLFSLSGGTSAQGWRVPTFLLELRGIRTLEEQHNFLVRKGWCKPRAWPKTSRLPTLEEDLPALAKRMYERCIFLEDWGIYFSSQDLAGALSWTPERFNRSMNALDKSGWLEVDPTSGSAPFDARGFELTTDGILALEEMFTVEALDSDEPPVDYEVNPKMPDDWIPLPYRHLKSDMGRFHDDDPFDRSVFVMMKFPDHAHMEHWQLDALEHMYGAVKDELERHGLVARRADKKTYATSKQLWDNLCIYMLGCRYGVAILEDHVGDELNPNVALEYGFMKGQGREVILLKEQRFKHLRADLVGTIPKEFKISSGHTVDKRSIQDAVSNWLTDIGIPPKRGR